MSSFGNDGVFKDGVDIAALGGDSGITFSQNDFYAGDNGELIAFKNLGSYDITSSGNKKRTASLSRAAITIRPDGHDGSGDDGTDWEYEEFGNAVKTEAIEVRLSGDLMESNKLEYADFGWWLKTIKYTGGNFGDIEAVEQRAMPFVAVADNANIRTTADMTQDLSFTGKALAGVRYTAVDLQDDPDYVTPMTGNVTLNISNADKQTTLQVALDNYYTLNFSGTLGSPSNDGGYTLSSQQGNISVDVSGTNNTGDSRLTLGNGNSNVEVKTVLLGAPNVISEAAGTFHYMRENAANERGNKSAVSIYGSFGAK